MKKKTILAISTMLFLCACSQETYYQVYDVHSPDVAMKNEVLIFKGNKKISVTRRYAASPKFNRMFRKQYEK